MSAPAAARGFAPASIGNCAVGFDVLGHSLAGHGDTVTVRWNDLGRVRITAVRGLEIELPLAAERNTAGRALLALLPHAPPGRGFDAVVEKGIALGSGMGGSAASAVAAVVAANALLPAPLDLATLYAAAMQGEAAATGAAHGDNVGPALLGGLVIAPAQGAPVRVPVPAWLHIGLVRPHFALETRTSRAALAGAYELAQFVQQSEGLALVLAGCFRGDADLIGRGLRDVLVEPRRAPLIPGFAAVQRAALDHGALGASIAGGGPSVFGWFRSAAAAAQATAAMQRAFAAAGLASSAVTSPVDGPAAEVRP
ncbi:MAG: homoserine kinase [Planctomycetes bacterium]|nr:homoserine kinase [Planctomycetota bacterium]